MSTSIEAYAGRTNDLVVFHGAQASGRTQLQMNLSDGEICTGVQKVAQNVAILLFTEKGSDPFEPTKGTAFMGLARQSRLQTEVDIQVQIGRAIVDIIQQLSDTEVADTPDDERLIGINLRSFSFVDGNLVLELVLTTNDPERAAILPIDIPLTV